MAEAFQAAVGEDGEMDAYELMTVLNETGFISGMFKLDLWNETYLMKIFQFKEEKPIEHTVYIKCDCIYYSRDP